MKRIIALFLVLVMLLSSTAITAFADSTGNDCVIGVSNTVAKPGDRIAVPITIEKNPGILGATLTVSWDEGLTLIKIAENGEAFSALGLTASETKLTSPYNLVWYTQKLKPTDIKDGVIATLEFDVSAEAQEGDKLNISVSYVNGNIFDTEWNDVFPAVNNGMVSVVTYKPGDVDGNNTLNAKDLVLLSRYIADGCKTDPESYNVSLNPNAGDVDNNGVLNAKDLVLNSRYQADGCTTDPESYNVKLLPSSHDFGHTHTMQVTAYKAATCTEDGNNAYWYCTTCQKYFSNEAGTTEIDFEDVVIHATGHNVIIDEAVPATNQSKGLTEGSHCSVCNKILVEQEEYGPLPTSTANIIYKLVNENKDPYLAQQTIINHNPRTYEIGKGVTLSNDLQVKGYTFVGWFDSFDDGAEQIKSIPATAENDVTLYAHWNEEEYTITYNLYQTPAIDTPTPKQEHYTVSKGNSNLYNPTINNYKFLGWYDENGVEYKAIPVGSTGHIVLNAYYTSLRNLAVSKTDSNPIILEDQNNNVVYFAYEIGEIRNIPLNADNPFWKIQSVAGLSQQVEETYTTTTSEAEANSVSKEISDMTVSSNTWTLAETWNDITTVNESWAESIGKTTEQCKTEATTSSNTLSISDQMGGSTYHKTEDGSTVYDYNSKTVTKDKGHQFDASLNGSYANKVGANFGTSTEFGTENSYNASNAYTRQGQITADNWSASGSQSGSSSGSSSVSDKDKYSSGISYENGFEVNAGLSYGYHNNTNTVTKTGTDKVTTSSNIDENTSSWNSSASMTSTNQRSISQTVRNTLSDIVTTTKGYGSSYSQGGTDSTTQGFSATASNTAGTSSTVTYSKIKGKTTTSTYKVEGKIEGEYRCILVGKAHVFAVVGYDYNTKSFFTYTFSVMDDETKEFLDYTPSGGDFTDCENSCLPFEVPIDIFEYVNGKISKTTGIEYITDSQNEIAKITKYVGTDADVIIPSYVSDGSQAYKVTEIADTAFAGKPVRSVVLSEFIETIPDGAFKNCTKLEEVIGSFTEIGDEAFAGCVKLTNMNIPSNVVKIGEDSFKGVASINARAINSLCAYSEAVKELGYISVDNLTPEDDAKIEAKKKEITQNYVQSVLDCGAENIILNLSCVANETPLTLEVPDIGSLEVDGGGKAYKNVSIHSNANETFINEMSIENTWNIPLKINSNKLILKKVFINSNNLNLVLEKDGAVLSLVQDSALQTTSQDSIIAKNPVIESQVSAGGASGILRVNGHFGYVNSIEGKDYINITNGEIKKISEEEFEKYKKGLFTVTFDANGGTCSETSKQVTYLSPIGTLPTASREGFSFDGWYHENGTQATVNDTFTKNETLRAQWVSGWVQETVVPASAQIISTKWKFESSQSKINELNPYNSTSQWSDYGAWSEWSDTQYYESEFRKVESDPNVVDSYNMVSYVCSDNHGYARGYYSYKPSGLSEKFTHRAVWTIGDMSGAVCETQGTHHTATSATDGYIGGNGSAYYLKYNYMYQGCNICQPMYIESINYKTQYRYSDRTLIYTYFYEDVVDGNSTQTPSGNGITNVQKYVQYRVK